MFVYVCFFTGNQVHLEKRQFFSRYQLNGIPFNYINKNYRRHCVDNQLVYKQLGIKSNSNKENSFESEEVLAKQSPSCMGPRQVMQREDQALLNCFFPSKQSLAEQTGRSFLVLGLICDLESCLCLRKRERFEREKKPISEGNPLSKTMYYIVEYCMCMFLCVCVCMFMCMCVRGLKIFNQKQIYLDF